MSSSGGTNRPDRLTCPSSLCSSLDVCCVLVVVSGTDEAHRQCEGGWGGGLVGVIKSGRILRTTVSEQITRLVVSVSTSDSERRTSALAQVQDVLTLCLLLNI